MHELSVCRALVEQVETVAREHGARAVRSVRVRIGPLSGVEARLLEEAYSVASAGTLAEGSQLAIEVVAVRVRCETCGTETETEPNRLRCGFCGSTRTRLAGGDEMLLVSVQLSI